MTARLCPQCHGLLDIETVSGRPARLVSFCGPCNLVITRADLQIVPDYPRSSDREDVA